MQIWDPFAAVCRDVYCPAEFDLTSFTCLDGGGVNGSIYDEEPITVLPSSSVELTFTILVVDTAIPAPPPPSDPVAAAAVLADVIISHFPKERSLTNQSQFASAQSNLFSTGGNWREKHGI